MQKIILILLLIFFYSISYSQAADEYFRTLRNDEVNLRQGPSFEYPIKIIYKKKFLPILVQDSSDNFRKVRDHENNTGWVHISQLSKKKQQLLLVITKSYLKVQQFFPTQWQYLKKEDLLKLKNVRNLGARLKLIIIRVGLKKIVYGDCFEIIFLL